ncbi:MAG: hypothetical protein ACK5HP_02975 [Bacilli bacterium]
MNKEKNIKLKDIQSEVHNFMSIFISLLSKHNKDYFEIKQLKTSLYFILENNEEQLPRLKNLITQCILNEEISYEKLIKLDFLKKMFTIDETETIAIINEKFKTKYQSVISNFSTNKKDFYLLVEVATFYTLYFKDNLKYKNEDKKNKKKLI